MAQLNDVVVDVALNPRITEENVCRSRRRNGSNTCFIIIALGHYDMPNIEAMSF
jgi:hypothetical protein